MIKLLLVLLLQLDLSNVISADIQRKDVNQDVRIVVTLNLMGGMKYTTDFFLGNDDSDKFKNGTNKEKIDLRKKYIRQTIKNYLDSLAIIPTEVDRGTNTVPKANFTDPGDIGQ